MTDSFEGIKIFSCCLTKSIQIEIETQRLIIRNYRMQDLPESFKVYGDPDVTKYFDSGSPKSEAEVLELIQGKAVNYFLKGKPWGLYSIISKETKSFLGHLDLFPCDFDNESLEIGYILSKTAQGQGFGSEAARGFVENFLQKFRNSNLFSEMGLYRTVIATVHPENISSKKILEKLGMQKKQTLNRFNSYRDVYSLSFD